MDKRYYYFNGNEQIGPLNYSDLFNRNLTPDTLFWYEGLPQWKKGYELPELANLFNRSSNTPPVNPPYNQPPYNQPPYTPPTPYPNPNPNQSYSPPYPSYQLQPTPPAYEWYFMAWQKYAQFTGRARRSEYWYFTLFHFIILIIASVIDEMKNSGSEGYGLLTSLYYFATIVPYLAVAVRRIHDTGQSGWFILVPVYNLILLCTEGNRGPNQYGPDPKYV
ncbi:DUF805 domain-containing protein [Spirosoma panaciterrae]|uniref:DUF805 domain-containing protein n=1 Tax=Spirosoma panaciterrae TaxID=496058 RepID=UPI00035D8A3E|nr:DUF805 domain-containing protein [Spirosoma panaciterrae]